ncbi:hypothetical protein SCHPADRAFT_945004 [Schizopora paradoxa]|uniref:DUF6533 domain-containing protein n=1 Tax=Schizopora paradoxa TaxID=27342 RepID=A0A0H2RDZ6_9AGAM|nr:hypothetical protein SCHPADRAFT_945004 [Schizopora paradoxa]
MDADIPLSELGPILSAVGVQIASQKYAMLAFFAVFMYDFLLTFDDEIKYIWRRKITFVSVAYLMVASITEPILRFMRIYSSYLCELFHCIRCYMMIIRDDHRRGPVFNDIICANSCKRYAPLQIFGEGIPLTIFTDLVIGLRVYALYKRNVYIGIGLILYIVVEFAISFWIYSIPSIHPVTLPGPPSINQIPALHICLGSASSTLTNLESAAYLFLQAAYDSIVFGLLLFKTVSIYLKERNSEGVHALIAKHGLLYYAIVFTMYFTWAMMTIFSPPGLKYAAASPTIMMACLAVNKLTLSLRGYYEAGQTQPSDITTLAATSCPRPSSPSRRALALPTRRRERRQSWIGISTFEVTHSMDDDYVFGLDSSESPSNDDTLEPTLTGTGAYELRMQVRGHRQDNVLQFSYGTASSRYSDV